MSTQVDGNPLWKVKKYECGCSASGDNLEKFCPVHNKPLEEAKQMIYGNAEVPNLDETIKYKEENLNEDLTTLK